MSDRDENSAPIERVRSHIERVNVAAAAEADLYGAHRVVLSELLAARGGEARRLCLLGAGNCNDVDLGTLASAFSEIHLVDIDHKALAAAVDRQVEEVRARLRVHTLDLSGLFAHEAAIRSADEAFFDPEHGGLFELVAPAVEALVSALPGPFDVCASTCLWSQLSAGATSLFPPPFAHLPRVREAMLSIHLQTLVALAPVGEALFVTDVSSTTLVPSLEDTFAMVPPDTLLEELFAKSFIYVSADPKLFAAALARSPTVEEMDDAEDPWLWHTKARVYLVKPTRYRRRVPGTG